MRYRRIHLLLEGPTEETVTVRLFQPFLESFGWSVTRSVLITRRPAAGSAHRGGVSTWAKLHKEMRALLRDSSIDLLTTVIDYYGFPADAPGMANRPAGSAHERVQHVEAAIARAIGDDRFVPHLSLHETEAWVYAAAVSLGELLGAPDLGTTLQREADSVGGPELVNDGPTTAPSKRLAAHWPRYSKLLHGPRALSALGLDKLRGQCPHLDAWLTRLETVTPL
jgi:hypothetical protein